jgi:hypothetical protein
MSAGKGDKPRNCFSREFKDNYDLIDWGSARRKKIQKMHGVLVKPDEFPCQDCNSQGDEMLVEAEFRRLQPKKYRESSGFYFIRCRECKGTKKVSYDRFKQQLGIA